MGENFHTYAAELAAHYLLPGSPWAPNEAGVEPLPDNFLLNSQNTYDCSIVSSTFAPSSRRECNGGQLYSTKIKSGDSVRLRLINHSSYLSYWFSIDNHTLSIVEIDGVEVNPITSRGVHVNIGQRYSVIINCTQMTGNYYIRATLPKSCFIPYSPYVSAPLEEIGYQVKGILSYDEVDALRAQPIGVEGNTTNPYGVYANPARAPGEWEGCDDMPFDMPVPMRAVPAYEVGGEENSHSVVFQFRQAGEINRIFINKAGSSPFWFWFRFGGRYANIGMNRRPGALIATTRRSGRPWSRTLRLEGVALTITGGSGWINRSCSSPTPTRACRWLSTAWMSWNIPFICSK